MRRLVTAAVLLLLGSSAYAQTTCSATCRACGSTVVGGSGGAPTDAQYVTAAADATLSAERVCTDTTTIDCDAGTAGQMKFNLITPIQVATGCATPNFSFVDDSGAGVCLNAADVARLQIGTTDYVQVDTNQFIYVKGGATVMTVTGNGLTFGSTAGTADWFVLTPQAAGAAGRYGELTTADLTANRTFTFPDATGDVAVIASGGFPARTAAQTWATRTITASTGGVVANGDGVAGNPSVGPDTATTPQFSSGTGDVPGTGAVGTFYAETDANSFYTYPSTNTEHWLLSIAAGAAQGDLFYASAADVLSSLAKDTNSTRYLSNQGTSNNPSWNQVNLTNGVTGDLPLSNVAQASGASVLLGRGSAGGAGDFQEISLGTNLSMSGTTLSASGGSSFDPGTTFEFYEEFCGGYISGQSLGQEQLTFQATGSGVASQLAGTGTHPCLLRITTTATDNSGGLIPIGNNSGAYAVTASDLRSYDWVLKAVMIPGSNSTAITNTATYFGVFSSGNGPDSSDNGIWVRRDTDHSDTAFRFQLCDASGAAGCQSADADTNSDVANSSITPSAGNAYLLTITHLMTGVGGNETWYFQVNAETAVTFCSSGCTSTAGNAPATGSSTYAIGAGYYDRDTGGAVSGDVDFIFTRISGMQRYN